MATRFELHVFPLGGINKSIDPSYPGLSKPMDDSGTRFVTQAVDGSNWTTDDTEGICEKSDGYTAYTDAALSTGDIVQEMMVLNDGTNINLIAAYKGKLYTITAETQTNIDAASPVTFDTGVKLCMIQYGAYVVVSSISVTPYKWKHGDTNLTKLILSGTEYKFKYMEQFHNHIIGAYSDQTNGSIDIRYTDALPTMASLSFPAANQLYKPDNDIGITGIKRLGNIACLIYGENSIYSLEYFQDYNPVFACIPQVTGVGTSSHWSIVDLGDSHAFYDKSRGFVRYYGGKQFEVISEPIDSVLSTIKQSKMRLIHGMLSKITDEIIWVVPSQNSNIPQIWCRYNLKSKKWHLEERQATSITYQEQSMTQSTITWQEFANYYGGADAIWSNCGTDIWTTAATQSLNTILFGNSTGYVYQITGDTANATDFAAWRTEPVMWQPDPRRYKRIQQLEVVGPETGEFSLDFYWRGGDTQQALKASVWESIGSVSLASTADPVLYLDKTNRFHQFKWGTDLKSEHFKVNQIKIKGLIY